MSDELKRTIFSLTEHPKNYRCSLNFIQKLLHHTVDQKLIPASSFLSGAEAAAALIIFWFSKFSI